MTGVKHRGALVLAAATLFATAANAQPVGAQGALDLHLLRLVAALTFCSLLAVAVALALKRYSGGRLPSAGAMLSRAWSRPDASRVSIIEARRLSPHADLCRFTSGGREYLIVVSPGGTTLLRETEVPEDATAPP